MVRKLVPSIYPQRLCWLVVFCVLSATAVADEFDKFFGVYHGEAISDTDGELQTRDLRVTIEETDGGFNLTWTLLKHKVGGKVERQEYSINFEPSRREGIYRSAMRQNVFGQQIPLDPLNGDAYVWGWVDGDSLVVYGLIILDGGGYEIQQWVRTLTESGMRMEFSRIRNGEILRTVTGDLKKH